MVAVVVAIAILGILIFVHEWGHFIAARSQGIHVNRFSIGFGPILWKFQGKDTEYALRLIPLGGYVGFPDDDPNSSVPANDPNLLSNPADFGSRHCHQRGGDCQLGLCLFATAGASGRHGD